MLRLDTDIWFKYYWQLPLSAALQQRIDQERAAISSVSPLEIATKIRKRRFPGMPAIEGWLSDALVGFVIAPLTPEIAAAAGADTWEHQDPLDQLLVQTALANNFTFAHSDSVIRKRKNLQQFYVKFPST